MAKSREFDSVFFSKPDPEVVAKFFEGRPDICPVDKLKAAMVKGEQERKFTQMELEAADFLADKGADMDASKFGKMLKEARGLLGKQQADMAADLGYSPQYLCDLENGRRTPSVEFVTCLCVYLALDRSCRRRWNLVAAQAHGWDV